jgi:hypothetical protein
MNLPANYYWNLKRGSVGKVLSGQLRDANGPFEITGTLSLSVKRPRSTSPALTAACTPDPDQTANKGKFTFTVTSEAAALAAGTYRIEFVHTDGGTVTVWPDDANPNKTYGSLVVTESL